MDTAISQLLEQQKTALRAAEGRKGEKPTEKTTRELLAAQFRRIQVSESYTKPNSIRQCVITQGHPPSTTPLSELQPISISELRLETRHAGRVLIVRTFSEPARLQGVMSCVEDVNLDVELLGVYTGDPDTPSTHTLPKCAVFAVKEPLYKVSNSGGYVIRVDHPSDIFQLKSTCPMFPAAFVSSVLEKDESALTYKNVGNAAYKTKDFLSAAEAYTQGLRVCSESEKSIKHDLYRNRAMVNIYLQRYEQASKDAVAALNFSNDQDSEKNDQDNVKAHYRAGRAFYGLGLFTEAQSHFHRLLQISPNDEDGLAQLARTNARIEEMASGEYDFKAMKHAFEQGHRRLDHANFTTNVEIQRSENKGRGLFATRDIKAGELILVEKAFAASFGSEAGSNNYLLLNLNTNTGNIGPQGTLYHRLVQKMLHNPSQARPLLNLFDGGYFPKCTAQIVDGVAAIDTFQVGNIMMHNAFGIFTMHASRQDNESIGLWNTTSYANHACDANAHRSFVGDMIILRATKDIQSNTEVSIDYHDPDLDYEKTQEFLQRVWNFKCTCHICTAEAKTSVRDRKERQRLIQRLENFMGRHQQSLHSVVDNSVLSEACTLFRKLDATYNKQHFSKVPRIPLLHLADWLCTAYADLGIASKMIEYANKTLEESGYQVELIGGEQSLRIDHSNCLVRGFEINAAMCAVQFHNDKGNLGLSRQYEAFAKERYQLVFGDLRRFEETYRNTQN